MGFQFQSVIIDERYRTFASEYPNNIDWCANYSLQFSDKTIKISICSLVELTFAVF